MLKGLNGQKSDKSRAKWLPILSYFLFHISLPGQFVFFFFFLPKFAGIFFPLCYKKFNIIYFAFISKLFCRKWQKVSLIKRAKLMMSLTTHSLESCHGQLNHKTNHRKNFETSIYEKFIVFGNYLTRNLILKYNKIKYYKMTLIAPL